jgi:hypothetical protein
MSNISSLPKRQHGCGGTAYIYVLARVKLVTLLKLKKKPFLSLALRSNCFSIAALCYLPYVTEKTFIRLA